MTTTTTSDRTFADGETLSVRDERLVALIDGRVIVFLLVGIAEGGDGVYCARATVLPELPAIAREGC